MEEVKVPSVGESITEVTVGEWTKQSGDFVEMDEVLCELESDKATFELNAPVAGVLEISVEEGETINVGDIICKIAPDEGGESAPKKEEAPKEDAQPKAQSEAAPDQNDDNEGGYADGHPSPAAQKILAEKGLNPDDVKGTGPGGRITKEDAEKAKAKPASDSKPSSTPAPKPAAADGDRDGVTRKRMTTMRRTIARRLVEVKNETAMLTTFNEVDMGPVMALRSKYKDKFVNKHDVKLGFMSFFVKASAIALLEHPNVNAIIDGDSLLYHDYADISIAVSTPKGLVVPVLKNAHTKSFAAIESEIIELATKARDGKITMEDMQGGTFTITNGGIFGSMLSTPIINAPQSGILGMHNIVERPMAQNGQVVIKPMMYIALSYDHRVIDGKDSVTFLVRLKELLEDPSRMLLQI